MFSIRPAPPLPPPPPASTLGYPLLLGVLVVTLVLVFAFVGLRRYIHRKQDIDIDDNMLPLMPQARNDVLLDKSGALLPLEATGVYDV